MMEFVSFYVMAIAYIAAGVLGISAIVAVIDDEYLDRVDAAVAAATKKVNKAIDKGDYDAIVNALNEGGEKIVAAVDSKA